MAEIESDFNKTLVKYENNPASLTQAEEYDIASYLLASMSLYVRVQILHRLGLVTDDPDLAAVGEDYFGGQLARDWYEANKNWIRLDAPALADAIETYIASTPISSHDSVKDTQ